MTSDAIGGNPGKAFCLRALGIGRRVDRFESIPIDAERTGMTSQNPNRQEKRQ